MNQVPFNRRLIYGRGQSDLNIVNSDWRAVGPPFF